MKSEVAKMALYALKDGKRVEWRSAISDFIALHAPRTAVKYETIFREFETVIGKELIESNEPDGFAYAQWAIKQPGRAPGSTASRSHVRSKLSILCNFFEVLKDEGFCEKNPCRAALKLFGKAHVGDVQPSGEVSPEDVRKLLKGQGGGILGKRNVAILALLFGGALRAREMLAIKISDVRHTSKGTWYVHLSTTKAGKAADQGLQTWAADAVRALYEARKAEGATLNDPLICAYYSNGTPYNTFAEYDTFLFWWRRMIQTAGLDKNITPHWARCTAINRLAQKGIPLVEIQDFSRHASVGMVEYYLRRHVDLEKLPQKDLDYEDD